jgi:glycine/D-amino acid oxidase-like deaminating enzyme
MSTTDSFDATTVILGSGIVGLSTAYFLCESGNTDPKSIHLVDASSELFHCASGLAGGFLAEDCMFLHVVLAQCASACFHFISSAFRWKHTSNQIHSGFAPSVASLGALSYKLHAQLAAAHSGRATWGYAHSTGISLSQDSEEAVSGSGEDWLESGTSRAQLANHNRPWEEEGDGPQWLRRTREGVMEVISRGGTTAQIDPLRFCRWLLGRCQQRGVQLHNPARALSVSRDEHGILSGVRISQDGTETNRKDVTVSHHTLQLTFRSTMHTSRDHVRGMVSPCLQYALPLVRNTCTHICSRWSLIACTQSAFQA